MLLLQRAPKRAEADREFDSKCDHGRRRLQRSVRLLPAPLRRPLAAARATTSFRRPGSTRGALSSTLSSAAAAARLPLTSRCAILYRLIIAAMARPLLVASSSASSMQPSAAAGVSTRRHVVRASEFPVSNADHAELGVWKQRLNLPDDGFSPRRVSRPVAVRHQAESSHYRLVAPHFRQKAQRGLAAPIRRFAGSAADAPTLRKAALRIQSPASRGASAATSCSRSDSSAAIQRSSGCHLASRMHARDSDSAARIWPARSPSRAKCSKACSSFSRAVGGLIQTWQAPTQYPSHGAASTTSPGIAAIQSRTVRHRPCA